MKKRTMAASVVVALLALCLFLLMRRGSDSNTTQAPRGVSLAFRGLTNLPTKGDVAVFFVTNAGPERVSFSPDAFEYRDAQAWVTNSLRNQRRDGWLYWYHDLTGNLRLGNWYDGSIAGFVGEMGDAVPQAPWDFSLYDCSCRGDGTGRSG
jgi:hypothetical protein